MAMLEDGIHELELQLQQCPIPVARLSICQSLAPRRHLAQPEPHPLSLKPPAQLSPLRFRGY